MKFIEIQENDGEYVIVMQVQNENDQEIKGRIVYTSSAYGSAVVSDVIETGRLITVNKSDMTSVRVIKQDSLNDILSEGIERRNKLADGFITSDEQVIQNISIDKSEDGLVFTFLSTLPGTEDEEGIPVATESYYYATENTKPSNLENAFNERHSYVSSSGRFLKETKVFYEDEKIGTLAAIDYSKISDNNVAIAKTVLETLIKFEKVA